MPAPSSPRPAKCSILRPSRTAASALLGRSTAFGWEIGSSECGMMHRSPGAVALHLSYDQSAFGRFSPRMSALIACIQA